MPEIAQYNAGAGALHPSDLAEEANVQAARRLGTLGNERGAMLRQTGELQRQTAEITDRALTRTGAELTTLGEKVEAHAAQQEIIGGFARSADLLTHLDDLHRSMVEQSDPFDPTVGERYRAAAHEVMQDFTSSFQTPAGKEWAARHSANILTELYRHSTAEDVSRAQQGALIGINDSTNKLAALAARNPAYTPTALSMIPGTLAAAERANPALHGIAGLDKQMGQHIALSGLKSAIDADPVAGLAMLHSGRYDEYVGDQSATLEAYARAANRRNLEQGRADLAEAKRQEREDANNQLNQIIFSTLTPNGPRLPPDYYLQLDKLHGHPGIEHGALEGAANYGRQLTNEQEKETHEGHTDPHTYADMISRLALPDGDPRKLTATQAIIARGKGELDQHDFEFILRGVDTIAKDPAMRQNLKDFNDFVEGYKRFITKSTMLSSDAIGDQRLYEFRRDKLQQFQAGIAAGKPAQSLLDPRSKDFIGGDVNRYQPTMEQLIQQRPDQPTQPLPPVPAARNQGESPEAYLKRIGQ